MVNTGLPCGAPGVLRFFHGYLWLRQQRICLQCRRPLIGKGWEEPLEKEMAIHSNILHSNILAWRTPWTEKPGRLQSIGSQKSHKQSDCTTNTHFTGTGEIKAQEPLRPLCPHILMPLSEQEGVSCLSPLNS